MSFTFVGAHIETGSTNSPPTGAAADDLLICMALNTGSGNTLTPPSGWTEIQADPNPADFSVRVFYRVMQAGDTTWTWTWSAGTKQQTTCAIRGADTTTPIDVSSATAGGTFTTFSTASVTPSAAGEMFVGLWSADASGRTWTEDASLTEQLDGNGGTTLDALIATEVLSGTSAVTRSATVSGTAQDIAAYAVVLKAAASGGTPQTVPVGQATETDAAQTVTPVLGGITVGVGRATETDAAQSVTAVLGELVVPVGQAVETDTAKHVTVVQAGVTATTPTRTLMGVGI